jgi:hypothetical protein
MNIMKQYACRPAWLLVAFLAIAPWASAAEKFPNPDLVKGETKGLDRALTWNLGPTGMRGWIYNRPVDFLASTQGRHTDRSRQILVTDIGKGTPADGKIQPNDVIIGVNGKLFDADARKSFGWAINEAEKTSSRGILKLRVFRGGKTIDVLLKLKVMGSYSATSPYNCSKATRILEVACRVLEKEKMEGVFGPITGLALMATGNPKYLPKVREYARSLQPGDLSKKFGMVCWDWGYKNVFLCEYYLLTKDKAVLPAIKTYSVELASRQSMYGTFGHGGAENTPDGKLHGRIPSYGAINAAGLVSNLSIVLAKKCGISHPEIAPAIKRGAGFFRWYADKGSIPYGEHFPWQVHGSNGKTGQSALLFSVMGGHDKQAKQFAMLTTAAYQNRQYGHTGQGLSFFWTAPGAHVGGPKALAAFMAAEAWHFDLTRRSDGAFAYDGSEQYGPGKKNDKDNKYFGNATYAGLSPTATHVLTYSLPKRLLYITGKGASQSSWLNAKEVKEAIAAGRMDLDRKKMSTAQLVAALNNWSPIARKWIGEEIGKRPDGKKHISQLMKMAQGTNSNTRRGATIALGHLRAKEALPILVKLLRHDDRWQRILAAESIERFGGDAWPHVPAILKVVIDHDQPLLKIDWEDPVQLAQCKLSMVVFGHALLGGSIKKVDKKLFYETIRIASRSPSGRARSRLVHIFRNKLEPADVEALERVILESVRSIAPADTMYESDIRMAGMQLLVKYKYAEGIKVLPALARTLSKHSSERRIPELMTWLRTYGKHAAWTIPQLKLLIKELDLQVATKQYPGGAKYNGRRTGAVKETIAYLQTTQDAPKLQTMKK